MPPKINNIHDKFLKDLLSDRSIAIDFVKELLPPELLAFIKPDTLEQLPDTYISEELEQNLSDIVWRFQTQHQPLQIALLLEHKSYKAPKVVFQLLEYLAQAYRKQLKAAQKPELIVPIVYYHGKTKWKLQPIATFFEQYPEPFQKYVPSFIPEFIDLKNLDEKQLIELQNGMLTAALLAQKYAFDSTRLAEQLGNIIKSTAPYLEKNQRLSIFVYILQVLDMDKAVLSQRIENETNTVNSTIMSIYDQLIAEGIEKGILNAYNNGIALDTIRIISGESMEKIQEILKRNNKI